MTTNASFDSHISHASQMLSSLGLGHVGLRHDEGRTWVTGTLLPAADARRAVEALRAVGYVAADARDEHGPWCWVYVSPDFVGVRAYVDGAGDLMVELPEQRGCVKVRKATRDERDESEYAADGWIEARVARRLLVAVGYLPAGR